MPQLYSDLANHRSATGSWQAAAAGCRGLAAAMRRAHLVSFIEIWENVTACGPPFPSLAMLWSRMHCSSYILHAL